MLKARPSTLLAALTAERDNILAQLAMKPDTLKANLAATERLIAIFQARATEQAATAQPAVLKRAMKLRASQNGHGTAPAPGKHASKLAILEALATGPKSRAEMIAVAHDIGMNPKGLGAYSATKLVTSSADGIYSLTAKGRKRLVALTTPQPPRAARAGWTPARLKKFRATMKAKAARTADITDA